MAQTYSVHVRFELETWFDSDATTAHAKAEGFDPYDYEHLDLYLAYRTEVYVNDEFIGKKELDDELPIEYAMSNGCDIISNHFKMEDTIYSNMFDTLSQWMGIGTGDPNETGNENYILNGTIEFDLDLATGDVSNITSDGSGDIDGWPLNEALQDDEELDKYEAKPVPQELPKQANDEYNDVYYNKKNQFGIPYEHDKIKAAKSKDDRKVLEPKKKLNPTVTYVYKDGVLVDVYNIVKDAAKAYNLKYNSLGLHVSNPARFDKPKDVPENLEFVKEQDHGPNSDIDVLFRKYMWGKQRGWTVMVMKSEKAKQISKGRDMVAVEQERVEGIAQKFHAKGIKYSMQVAKGDYVYSGDFSKSKGTKKPKPKYKEMGHKDITERPVRSTYNK